jgi:hypothetical protein
VYIHRLARDSLWKTGTNILATQEWGGRKWAMSPKRKNRQVGKIKHPPTARVPAEPMPTGASWKRTVFLALFRCKIKFRYFRQELLRDIPERAAIRRISGGCFCVSLSGTGLMLSLSQFELSTYLIIFSGISAGAWWCSLDFLNQKQTVRRKVLQTHNRFGQVVGSILIAISAAWVVHLIDDYALEKELQLHTDWLVPASDPQPKTSCPVVDGALQILLGNNTVYATSFPATIVSVDRKPQLVLDRDDQGRVAVTGNIFDENDDAIAEIDRNHFTVDGDVFKLERPDRSTLSVTIKKHKEEVLSIRFVKITPTLGVVWKSSQASVILLPRMACGLEQVFLKEEGDHERS